VAALEEEDAGAVSLSAPDATLESEAAGVTDGVDSLVSFTSHYAKEVGVVQQAVNVKEEDLKARVGSDRTWRAQWCSALYV
jgi:hypothetical protein